MFIVGPYLLLKIIFTLGLQSTRIQYSSSFTTFDIRSVTSFLSDDTRHYDVLHQEKSSPIRQHSSSLISLDSAKAKQRFQGDVSMCRNRIAPIQDNSDNNVTGDCNYGSTTSDLSSGWMERLRQLRAFKEIHGHTMVPKRYKSNPSLGNWVGKQRQLYQNFQTGTKPCSLTQERIDHLNQLNFCWNAMSKGRPQPDTIEQNTVMDDEWWSHYKELCKNCRQHGDIHTIRRQSRLGAWLDRQRKNYDIQRKFTHVNTDNATAISLDHTQLLTAEKLKALSRISEVWWMSFRQWQWELRYRDLQHFAAKYGHCCVPISYSDNTQLAHWVSNQRKLFNLRNAGKRSELTSSRIKKLEAIGFVWNRWDYEFSKKKAYEVHKESS